MKRRFVALLAGVVVLVVGVVLLIALLPRSGPVTVSASSSAPGASLGRLLGDSGLPDTADAANEVWRSDGEADGAWLQFDWSRPQNFTRVSLAGTVEESATFRSALVIFDGGSSLLVTRAESGRAEAEFPAREASSVVVVFDAEEGASAVALAGITLDGGGGEIETTLPGRTSASSGEAAALSDGNPEEGETGTEWSAGDGETAPWVQIDYGAPREVASVQVFGPTQTAFDPASSASAELHGTLVFDDGSSLPVSGINGGTGAPTTIAFAPRMATSVRLELEPSVAAATVGLREFAVYGVGVTPPRWPAEEEPRYETDPAPPPPEECGVDGTSVGEPSGDRIALVCPAVGSAVTGESTVVVQATPRTPLDLLAWQPLGEGGIEGGAVDVVASGETDERGRASLSFDAGELPAGPLNLRVEATAESGAPPLTPVHVQLVNDGGVEVADRGHAPAGMTLQWNEQFREALSISETGVETRYAATKPAPWGPSQFGMAVFADPALGYGSLAVIGNEYLRIRAQPIDDRAASGADWGQEHVGGILSSADVGAAGFSAQYGYYEARILGAPGEGTWPAFWMLDTESATNRTDSTGEIDAVELYGHNTAGSCHSIHNWRGGEDVDDIDCLDSNGFSDWALSWHDYGVRVTPAGATFYIDGVEVSSRQGLDRHSEPYFFLLNLALDGGWPVELGPVGETADMYVDWVRVYS